ARPPRHLLFIALLARAHQRLAIDLRLGDVSQLLVGGLLLVEGLAEQILRLVVAEHLGKVGKRAVGGNLVMLGALPAGDERGIATTLFCLALGCVVSDVFRPSFRMLMTAAALAAMCTAVSAQPVAQDARVARKTVGPTARPSRRRLTFARRMPT